jgi:hypothetical protein
MRPAHVSYAFLNVRYEKLWRKPHSLEKMSFGSKRPAAAAPGQVAAGFALRASGKLLASGIIAAERSKSGGFGALAGPSLRTRRAKTASCNSG